MKATTGNQASRILKSGIRSVILLSLASLLSVMTSCEGSFRSDPFTGPIPEELSNLNNKAAEALQTAAESDSGIVRIALVSDSHYGFDELQDAILSISEADGIDLIVHCGDITQAGLYDEYKAAASILSSASRPVITLIGNHDHLAFGEELFREFFGPSNLVLEFGEKRFIFWDNTVWEHYEGGPDTRWLRDALENGDSGAVVFSHIPPWTEQLADTYGNLYTTLLSENSALISVHGHNHDSWFGTPYTDGIPYLVVGSTFKGIWQELIIQGDSIEVIAHEF